MARTILIVSWILALATGLAAPQSLAQTSLSEAALEIVPKGAEPEVGFRRGSFIAAPIPFSNPTIGNGLAGGGAWLYAADSASRTSSIGLGGFKTDNGSSGAALGIDLKLNANKYLVSALVGRVDLNYDFTAGPFDIPLNQSGDLYKIELSHGISQQLSFGIGLQYAETTLSTNFGGLLPPEVSASLDLQVFKYGLVAEWDRRDSDLYPTTGSLVTLDAFRGDVTGSGGTDYEKAVLQGSHFAPGFREDEVVAVSATLCKVSDGAPFFDSCSIGLTDGLRGFSFTEFIGNDLISAQAEYRGRFGNGRFGFVAFVGAGSVSSTLTSESGAQAAAGVGFRYRLSNAFPVDFSVDVARNSDADTLYYIYVGQSF